ncbi:hypothetical protein AB0B89_04825 [Sphaerisporangium sp. NPDC049002]|uniref:hypothetical protein n=1 Tax=Sphaerisporangium sp. NPDC049002 TaxID=3155392 RepID=UPI0033D6284E
MEATIRRGRLAFTPKTAWGLADQALASASSIALTVVVAREVDIWALGAFAVANTFYMIILGFSRTVVSEPLLVRFSHVSATEHRRGTRQSTGLSLVIGLLGGALLLAAWPMYGDAVAEAIVPLAIFLPGLLLKDAWRFAFIAAGRPGQAMLNDLIWAGGQVAGVGWVLLSGRPGLGGLVTAWAASAAVAALAGSAQARLLPSPLGAGGWIRGHRDLLPAYTVEFLARAFGRNLALLAVGWVGGLPTLGAIRAAEVVYGPLNVVLQAGSLVAIPQAVGAARRSLATLRATVVAQSGALTALAACYAALTLVFPDGLGKALVGGSWAQAQAVLLPTALIYAGVAAMTGPIVGLRALGDNRRSPAVRLALVPLTIGCGVAGGLLGGAVGAVTGLGLANLAGAALWTRQFHNALVKPIQRPSRGDTMELSEYGRRYRGIILPLAAIPIVAALGGASWTVVQPSTYRHVVELQVAAPSDTAGPAVSEQSIATFRTLVTSSTVTARVVRETGADADAVAGGLSTTRLDNGKERGAVVQVVFSGTDARQAAVITKAAAVAALDELMRPYVERARSDTEGAKRAAQDRAKALTKAINKNGLAPDQYRVLYAEITRLRSELTAPTGVRDKAEILQAIDDRQKQLTRLTRDIVPFMSAQNEADQANRYLIQVQQNLRQAEARLAQSKASMTPVTAEGVEVGKGPLAARAAAMAAGIGALLAVVILVLRELLRQRRPVAHLSPSRRVSAMRVASGPPRVEVSPGDVRVIERSDRADQHRLN